MGMLDPKLLQIKERNHIKNLFLQDTGEKPKPKSKSNSNKKAPQDKGKRVGGRQPKKKTQATQVRSQNKVAREVHIDLNDLNLFPPLSGKAEKVKDTSEEAIEPITNADTHG